MKCRKSVSGLGDHDDDHDGMENFAESKLNKCKF